MCKNAFRLLCALLVTVLLAGFQFSPVRAGDFVVTNANDSGVGSLRQAIMDASDGDTITFGPSLAGAIISLASTLTIDKDLTIDASNLNSHISLAGNGVRAVFINQSKTVALIGLNVNGWSEEYEGLDGTGIYNEGTLTLEDCELSHSWVAFGSGGGIFNTGNVTMTNCVVSHNFMDMGGAAGILNRGTMTITNSIISGNHAGIFSFSGGCAALCNSGSVTVTNSIFNGNSVMGSAGAISNSGTMTVTNSTFSGNLAVAGRGGAISNSGDLTVGNSTFYNNRVDPDDMGDAHGGGIYNSKSGTLLVRSSSFSGNRADDGGGGIDNAGTMRLSNTILANSVRGGDCSNSGTILTNIRNLVEDGTCAPSLTGDPKLGALADNGGPTQTLAVLAGSPAIDAGSDAICPVTDQRGMPRPQGIRCDIGAYETGKVVIFRSAGIYDGSIIESSETSSIGGWSNSTLPTFKVGDSDQNRQFRAILSFDTSRLPDSAVAFRAILKIKKQNLTGVDPFTTHNGLIADTKAPYFGTSITLQPLDFQARSGYAAIGIFNPKPQGLWYVAAFGPTYAINKVGVTQFRLRFTLDDDNDNLADFFSFYSGNYSVIAARPMFLIEYYIP